MFIFKGWSDRCRPYYNGVIIFQTGERSRMGGGEVEVGNEDGGGEEVVMGIWIWLAERLTGKPTVLNVNLHSL